MQKRFQPGVIDTIPAVAVQPISSTPAHTTVAGCRFDDGRCLGRLAGKSCKSGADQVFEPSFGSVGLHVNRSESEPR